MANPIITNVGLVSRNDHLAVTTKVVVDGTTISADGVLKRGSLLCRSAVGGKYHLYVHGTDTAAVDKVTLLVDDVKVEAGKDAFGAGYIEGFFKTSSIVDAMGGAPFVAGDMLLAAGFHVVESDETRLK